MNIFCSVNIFCSGNLRVVKISLIPAVLISPVLPPQYCPDHQLGIHFSLRT